MNIEIYHDGSQYSANHTITFNFDNGSQLHRIEVLYRTMTMSETGHSLEEVLENVKKTLEFIRTPEETVDLVGMTMNDMVCEEDNL